MSTEGIMRTGSELIADERARQISDEGWTPEHDAQHRTGNLVRAAICYAAPIRILEYTKNEALPLRDPWPKSWDKRWDKRARNQFGALYDNEALAEEGRIRNLVKAGALIAAEIDRLLLAGRR